MKINFTAIFTCLLALFLPLATQAQLFRELAVYSAFEFTSIDEYRKRNFVDAAGNIYVIGDFAWNAQFGNQTITATNVDVFIAKYNAAGSLLWTQQMTGNTYTNVSSITSDSQGNVYVMGDYNITLTSGPFTIVPADFGEDNFFLAKFNSSGQPQWLKQGATVVFSQAAWRLGTMATDAQNNLYFSMNGDGCSFQDSVIAGINHRGPSIIKLNGAGQVLDVFSTGYNATQLAFSLDAAGNMYATGNFHDWVTFGSTTLTAPTGQSHAFVAKLTPTGQTVWATSIVGAGVTGLDISTNAGGEVGVTGVFGLHITLGNTTHNDPGLHYSETFVAKFSAAGGFEWGQIIRGPYWTEGHQVILTDSGKVYVSGSYHQSAHFGNTSLYSMHFSQGFIALYNSVGQLEGAVGTQGSSSISLNSISLKAPDKLVITGMTDSYFDSLIIGNLLLPLPTSGRFILEMNGDFNTITGKVFLDLNSSGTFDSGETLTAGGVVQLQPDNRFTFLNPNGSFRFSADTGNYQLSLPNPPAYYTVNPVQHSAAFQIYGQTDSSNYFALQPTGLIKDMQVEIVPVGVPRPGFTYSCLINYRNVGTVPVTGQLKFLPDSLLSLLNSAPAAAGNIADTLVWNYTNLQPFQAGTIVVNMRLDSTAALGSFINLMAQAGPLTTDQNPADNTYSFTPEVQGSYDPNDKLVSHNILSPAQVQARQPVIYTVRFQNTGTDTAFTVHVTDVLSNHLDLSSIEVLSSSHAYTLSFTGTKILQWHFANILLPDSGTNLAGSNGYVQYRIKPQSTATIGTHIKTHANIFFDFNLPIATNETDTKVALVSGLAMARQPKALHVYPNPNNGRFYIRYPAEQGQVKISLKTILGQTVLEQSYGAKGNEQNYEIEAANLPPGVYLLQLEHAGQKSAQRVILQR